MPETCPVARNSGSPLPGPSRSGPDLLMLDEPFTALDAESTRDIKDLIRKFVDEMKIPCIVVTHRLTDSSDIGDRACVLCSGKKEWEGLPREMPEECLSCQCP